jgi:hypothetical protein
MGAYNVSTLRCYVASNIQIRTLTSLYCSQAVVMLAGAIFTWWWVPNPCDIDGNPRSLEDLGNGKHARQAMERAEKLQRLQTRKGNH